MFARVLLHLSRQPRFLPGETVPPRLTQEGIALSLGTSRAAVSNVLVRLTSAGAVQVQRAHVIRRKQRVKTYQLSERGEAAARHIRESMERSDRESPAVTVDAGPPQVRGSGIGSTPAKSRRAHLAPAHAG